MELNRIIRKPILTEMALKDASEGKFTFEVDLRANKNSIAQALKKVYDVDAQEVRTRIIKGARIRRRGSMQERAGSMIKKATIVLEKGQKIPGFGI